MEEEQQLFLIEFLVDKVQIPVIRAMQDELLPASTCVSFQILCLPPIDICQEAPTDGCACREGDTQVFKKGKSCLFALPSIVLQRPLATFPIKMSVYKKLPPGVLPDVMLVGCHQIEAKALVNAVLSQQVFKIANPCQTIKDTFKIITATGQCVGSVTVYVRASCFGKKIITQFQIPHNRKPYLFKGADESPVFQCKRIPSLCYTPAPLRCTCKRPGNDGSGETARTCCQTPIVQAACPPIPVNKESDWGPRPCCLSRQSSPGGQTGNCPPCSPTSFRKEQQAPPTASCQPCCASTEITPKCGPPCLQPVPRCPPCCAPPPVPPCPPCCAPPPVPSCPPCCGASPSVASKGYKAFSDLLSKEGAVKKCGCAAKDYSCSCSRRK